MTIRDSWEELKAERVQRRQDEDALDAKIDRFVSWVTSLSQVAAGAPAEEVAPPIVRPAAPAPIAPAPARPVLVAVAPTWEPTRGVTATMWRDRADEGVDPAVMGGGRTAQPGDGWRHSWAALPAQIREGVTRWVWAHLSSSPFSPAVGPVPQMDVGPWLDGTRGTPGSYSPDLEDLWWLGAPARRPYVETHERDPRGRRDNGAGIDITPRFGAEIVKAAGQHPELTVEQLAQRYYEHPTELILDVWVEEIAEVHDGPSPHFTWAEVSASVTADEKGIANDVPADLRPGVIEFAQEIVEPLRTALGRPMKHGRDFTSWYRCPALNAALGSSATSGHLEGRGLDVPRTEELWRAIRAAKVTLPLRLNVEPDHYDVKVGTESGSVAVSWIMGAIKSAWEV